jgi:hypothetical protein
MGRTGKGKVVNRGSKYHKIFVYVPRIVATDTAFPFQIGEDVIVTIQNGKLIIEKTKERKKE